MERIGRFTFLLSLCQCDMFILHDNDRNRILVEPLFTQTSIVTAAFIKKLTNDSTSIL